MKYKTKKTLKTLALSVLGIGAIVGVASGVNALSDKADTELKTIYPTFEVGGLRDADGKYEESTATIYTKDAFECQGLEIALDFDNTIDYQVFYYESDGDFISASNVISGNEKVFVPLTATHARIEITPNWNEMGVDYANEKNQEIKWYEVLKYSTQLDIKVNKEQNIEFEDIDFSFDSELKGKYYSTSSLNDMQSESSLHSTNIIDVTEYNTIVILVQKDRKNSDQLYFADSTYKVTEYTTFGSLEGEEYGNYLRYDLDVEDFSYFALSTAKETNNILIYGK